MADGDHLNRYAEGWTVGDAAIVLESLDDSFVLDDPNSGMINKAGFVEYLNAFKGQVEGIRGQTSSPLLEFSEVETQPDGDNLTA